jgi:hypothetical protein
VLKALARGRLPGTSTVVVLMRLGVVPVYRGYPNTCQ